ncbi:uncharacterized protein [Antedon mediterranea]|uniref:uncharacterized protein n=1 Tax=Antedon mediterranea TaxID=105859 RepID=UPI003AF933B1
MTTIQVCLSVLFFVAACLAGTTEGRCIDVPVEYCRRLGFTGTYFPNHFYHRSISEAVTAFERFIAADGECSDDFGKFVCAAYFPGCTLENNVRVDVLFNPCRKLCNSAFKPCKLSFRRLKIKWPSELRCGSFPTSGCATVMDELVPSSLTTMAPTSQLATLASPVCEPLTYTQCNDVGYSDIMMPNKFNQTSQQSAGSEVDKFTPLITIQCSPALKPYLCVSYLPPCPESSLVTPCRSLCEAAKDGCVQVMESVGYKWPDHLNCSSLPSDNCYDAGFPAKGSDASEPVSTIASTENSQCEPLTIPTCQDLGYTSTMMPNMLGQMIQQDAELVLSTFTPLIQYGCSPALKPFLCSVYAPSCSEGTPIQPPCRSFCEKARSDCSSVLQEFGFAWPAQLNCSALPTEECFDEETSSEAEGDSQCEPLTIPTCQDLGYSSTMMQGQMSQQDAQLILTSFTPLIQYGCSPALKPFLCSLYAPSCSEGTPTQLPCRSFCENARSDCSSALQEFGFAWPAQLNCSALPTEECFDEGTSSEAEGDSQCEPLTIPTCQDLGYSSTMMLGQMSQQDAQLILTSFTPLIQYGCSPALKPFLCSLYAPSCSEDKPIQPPCRSFCEKARSDCSSALQEFGFAWPAQLNCSALPTEECFDGEITSEGEEDSKCERLTISTCQDLGYSHTMVPNMVGQMSQEDAQIVMTSLTPLIQYECSPAFKPYLCSMYAPSCSEGTPAQPPCRSFCEKAKSDCSSLLKQFGLAWPPQLNCEALPTEECFDGGFSSEVSTMPPQVDDQCEPITIPMCTDIGYTHTRMPNMARHRTQETAGLVIHQFYPLVKVECSPAMKVFLCGAYAPNCSVESPPKRPCRWLCEMARDECLSLMNQFGFDWPNELECSLLPNEGCYDGGITVEEVVEEAVGGSDTGIIADGSCQYMSLPVCVDMAYNMTRLPNVLGHTSQVDAMNGFIDNAILVGLDCSTEMISFLCSVYAPKCTPEGSAKPCRNMCERVSNDCQDFLSLVGMKWPEELECSKFTNEEDTCNEDINVENVTVTNPTVPNLQQGGCEPLRNPYCEGLSYNTTRVPNLIGSTSQDEAASIMGSFFPFISSDCAPDLKVYACSMFSPPCTDGPLLLPCRSLCEAVASKCGNAFASLGQSGNELLQCHLMPTDNCNTGSVDNEESIDQPIDGEESSSSNCVQIKSRRYDITTHGLSEYFRGWVDVQGQGAANDYCRVIRDENNNLDLTCALAGSEGVSEFNYGFDRMFEPGRPGEWYVRDQNGDGRDDYCRCVYRDQELYISCIPAMAEGFMGGQEFRVDVKGCGIKQFDPFIGPRQ